MADEAHFSKGAKVEVSNDEDGFRGAWYTATIIKPPPPPPPPPASAAAATKKKTRATRSGSTQQIPKVTIEYETLMANESGTKRLRETLDVVQIRPPPPRESERIFKFSEEVDAYHNDGWWEGVVTEVMENARYAVFFRGTREQMEFDGSDLRLHREWVNGDWRPPLEIEQVSPKAAVKTGKVAVKEKFSKGTLVEVSSDEDGFQGAWFAATVVQVMGKEKFLIEYQSLKTDDDSEFLKEEIDILHIRPYPPESVMVDRFNRFDEVDALYNDGWWVGIISKVLVKSRYIVYFRGTNEEMEFNHSDLRLHQDWIDGRWVMPSRDLKL